MSLYCANFVRINIKVLFMHINSAIFYHYKYICHKWNCLFFKSIFSCNILWFYWKKVVIKSDSIEHSTRWMVSLYRQSLLTKRTKRIIEKIAWWADYIRAKSDKVLERRRIWDDVYKKLRREFWTRSSFKD